MRIQNSEIALLVQKVRTERNITQKELALRLGKKTAAAISEIERNKTRISAEDLSIIADVLNTPIEYFYGEEIGDEEIKDFIAILRKAEPEAKETTLKITKATLSMQEAADVFSRDKDHKMTSEEAKRFVTSILDYKAYIDDLGGTLNGMVLLIESVFKQQGIKLPKRSH
jgi:transcriptional regulator with XRE-family HTH domain